MKKTAIKRFPDTAGYALFEQALLIPILFVLVLGAVDIHSALQSYTALQEGVRTSLRCVYTVDGNCIEVEHSSAQPIYEVSLLQPGANDQTYGHQYHYEGTEKYIQRPVYQVSNFRADVLSSVHYDLHQSSHFAERRWFPATGTTRQGILKAQYPLVLGTSPANNQFVFKYGRGSYPALFNFHQSAGSGLPLNVEGTANSGQAELIGTVSFMIPKQLPGDGAQPPALPGHPNTHYPNNENATFNGTIDPELGSCYRSTHYDRKQAPHAADLSSPCADSDQLTSERVRVVLYVEGRSNGGGSGVIRLRIVGGGSNHDLGGRLLDGTAGDMSLVPRGIHQDYIENSLYASQFEEFDDHGAPSDKLLLEYNTRYTLRFSLEHDVSSDDPVHWRANRVRIFSHQFELGDPDSEVDCSNPLLPSQKQDKESCATGPGGPAGVHEITVHTDQAPAQVESNIFVGHSGRSNQYTQAQLCNQVQLAMGIDPEVCVQDFSEMDTSPVVEVLAQSSSCPDIGTGSPKNLGVPQAAGSDGFIYNSPQAAAICPANGGVFPISNIRWSESSELIPGAPTASWVRSDCNEAAIPGARIPAAVKAYPRHDHGETSFDHYHPVPVHTGPGSDEFSDPDYLVVSDPQFNCQDQPQGFQAVSVPYHRSIPNLPPSSLFAGLQYELGCHWDQQVRNAAISLGMSSNAWFEPTKTDQTIVHLPGQPQQECVTFWTDPGAPEEKESLGHFTSAALPEVCHEPGNQCHLQFLGFDGESSSTLQIDPTLAAEYFGFSEIQATYPRAKWGCEEQDCVNIELAHIDGKMRANGKVYAPLNLMLGRTLELNYSEQRAWEGDLIR